jgi:gamma-glutamylcyclotransferase
LYFGYGSNLWLDQMARRCPESKFVGLGILRGWKWFINNRRYANVVRSSDDIVYGLVYKISPSDEASLDRSEGVPWAYTKQTMEIELQLADNGEERVVQGLVYVDEKRVGEGEPWEEYVYRMNMGINDAAARGLPKWYIDKYMRRSIPTEGSC